MNHIIDVRQPYEYQEHHAENAVNIPLDKIANEIQNHDVERSDQIIVYCRSGNRSAQAKAILEMMGYNNVINARTADQVNKYI